MVLPVIADRFAVSFFANEDAAPGEGNPVPSVACALGRASQSGNAGRERRRKVGSDCRPLPNFKDGVLLRKRECGHQLCTVLSRV
jgi:hypothetical protein